MMLAEKTSDRCETVVILTTQFRAIIFFGIYAHGTELVKHEGTSTPSDTLLAVDRRMTILKPYTAGDDDTWNKEYSYSRQSKNDVRSTFDTVVK